MSNIPKIVIAYRLPAHAPDLIRFARNMVTLMTGNADFASPNPPLATMTSHIDVLDTKEIAAQQRTIGAAAERDVAREVVVNDIHSQGHYVHNVALLNRDRATSLIEGAGLATVRVAVRTKNAIEVKHGLVSGSVLVVAKAAAKRATYYWQMSTDQKSWTSLPETMKAKTTVTGLTALTTYSFRVRALTASGLTEWSQIVQIIAQ